MNASAPVQRWTRRLLAGCAGLGLSLGAGLWTAAPAMAGSSPVVSKVSPTIGDDSGGETITILGSGFYCGTGGPMVQNPKSGNWDPPPQDYLNVYFGNSSASITDVSSDGKMTVVDPAGEGTVDVTVTCVAGNSVSSQPNPGDRFHYINSLSPASSGGGGGGGGGGDVQANAASGPTSLAQTGGGMPSSPLGYWLAGLLAVMALPVLATSWSSLRRLTGRG